MSAPTTTLLAWHYSTADRLQSIQRSGLILPASAGIPATERPVAWFSLHPRFEPTAAKGLVDRATGKRRTATIAEMIDIGSGLVRFGIPARELLTGEALRRKARISNAAWRQLCASGIQCGANPSHWFGLIGPMELARCDVQHFDPSTGTWASAANKEGTV